MNVPVTPEALAREYRRCLAREKDRYREWSKTRQGAFETYRVLHFDVEREECRERERSTSWLSDHGKGAAIIRRCRADGVDVLRRREAAAIEKVRRHAPHLLPVLRLVLKNGTNRRKSIEMLAKTRLRKDMRAAERRYLRAIPQLIELLKRLAQAHPATSRAFS